MAHKIIRFREVLFKKNFFLLWLGQIVSEFGDRLNQMALIALVYSKSPGSVMELAKLLFFVVVPVLVIGPVAGVYVDRWDRKKVMIISDIVRGCLVFLIPIFVYFRLMIPVYILVFLMFSTTRFFLPSKMAFIPSIVSEEKLMIANSLSNTTRILATIFGFAVAGLIIKLVGYYWGFLIDGISFFVSAAFIASITTKEKLAQVKKDIRKTKEIIQKSIRKHVWWEIVDGFKHMGKKDSMKIVTSSMFILMAGAGSVFCVFIVFVQETFGSGTQALGLFGTFLGIGLFLGTVIFGKYGQRLSKIRTLFGSFVFAGIFIGSFAVCADKNPNFLIGGLFIIVTGASVGPILTCGNTLIHELVPDEMRGRLFSSMEAVMHFAFLVFMMLTAYISRYSSTGNILLICGTGFAVIGVAGQIIVRKTKFKN